MLQEVAAARHVLIMCGSTTIDGYAFCLGVKSLELFYTASPELQTLPSVTYLIERAGLRSKHTANLPERFSLKIRSLAELIDMFHSRQASDTRDKVYALLGMSSDDTSVQPDYNISWEDLFPQIVKFVLGKDISVNTSGQRAVIQCEGCILGQVSSVRRDHRQNVDITSRNAAWGLGGTIKWSLQATAKPIQEGDIICLLQGASKPTIIRLHKDYFTVIVIAITPLKESGSPEQLEVSKYISHFPRDFLLVWDWEQLLKESQDREESKDWMSFDQATKIWNVALILGDLEEYEKAEKRLREAIKGYEIAFGKEQSTLKCQYGLTPLSWAAGNGFNDVVNLLLAKDGIDPDLKENQYSRTPLSWAAGNGHEATVRLLLETGKVGINLKDKSGHTPLWWAVQNGYDAVVKLLLETSKVEVDLKDGNNRTPLSWASENGHKAVVKLLLETSKVEVDLKDIYGQTPLLWAVKKGHGAVVKLLLETNKVEIDLEDEYGRTPLSVAVTRGHEAVVKLLLETGKVEVTTKNIFGPPLLQAATNGHAAIVKLLLKTGKVKLNLKDNNGEIPLSWAAKNGHEAVVKLLLETNRVEVDSKNIYGCTPLWWAVNNGHEAVVKLLLETGEVKVNSKNKYSPSLLWAGDKKHRTTAKLIFEFSEIKNGYSRTPLSQAAENGHATIIKLLLKTGKVKLNSKDSTGRTPISLAAEKGHEAVIKVLLETGKVKLNSKDQNGQTPILWAVKKGHKAIIKLLLETNKIMISSKNKSGLILLSWAIENEYEDIIKLLLEVYKVKFDSKHKNIQLQV